MSMDLLSILRDVYIFSEHRITHTRFVKDQKHREESVYEWLPTSHSI